VAIVDQERYFKREILAGKTILLWKREQALLVQQNQMLDSERYISHNERTKIGWRRYECFLII